MSLLDSAKIISFEKRRGLWYLLIEWPETNEGPACYKVFEEYLDFQLDRVSEVSEI